MKYRLKKWKGEPLEAGAKGTLCGFGLTPLKVGDNITYLEKRNEV